jgi:protein SCO1/2
MNRKFNFASYGLLVGMLTLTVASGCKPASPKTVASGPSSKSFAAHGVIRQIASDRHTITIQHDAIPGFMSAMTMDFPVKATNELNRLTPQDEITFQLVVTDHDSWVENIRFVAHRIEDVTNGMVIIHVPTAELKSGDLLPDYELVTEYGRRVHFSDFRGQVLAFTFFFTRCPLPDFCPRMNKNFFETRQMLSTNVYAPTNWQFLSISFDPGFDQPDMLARYGNYSREGNSDRWLFASASTQTLTELAPKLDLVFAKDGDGFSHNLRTVVLDPQGRIARQFDGNRWTPLLLAEAMRAAARPLTNFPPP